MIVEHGFAPCVAAWCWWDAAWNKSTLAAERQGDETRLALRMVFEHVMRSWLEV
jgi:hypothetical protein